MHCASADASHMSVGSFAPSGVYRATSQKREGASYSLTDHGETSRRSGLPHRLPVQFLPKRTVHTIAVEHAVIGLEQCALSVFIFGNRLPLDIVHTFEESGLKFEISTLRKHAL